MKLQRLKNQSQKVNAKYVTEWCAVVLGLYEWYQTEVVHKVLFVAVNHWESKTV